MTDDDFDIGVLTCPECGTRCQPIGPDWVCRHCDVVVLYSE